MFPFVKALKSQLQTVGFRDCCVTFASLSIKSPWGHNVCRNSHVKQVRLHRILHSNVQELLGDSLMEVPMSVVVHPSCVVVWL